MKFLLVEHAAASEIISDHVLQVTSFEQGAALAAGLKSGRFPERIGTKLHFVPQAGGVYVLAPEKSDDRIIFDLVQCPLFDDVSDDQALLVLQRGLRFAVKIWKNLRHSAAEYFTDSGKAVYFPFPLTSRSSFRIAIEREPLLRRTATAGTGKTLLVFAAGVQDDLGANISPDTKIASSALDALSNARGVVATRPADAGAAGQHYRVTTLDRAAGRGLISMSFSQWLNRLTKDQHSFVTRAVAGPERIEGPAGTGKTLSLILKALYTLRQAAASGEEHHSAFIAHSEATRRSIREVLSSLDEEGVVDAPRTAGPRSLRVTTLQEWSAQLLGERMAESELLDLDAMGSKELQVLYVLEAFQEAKRADLPSHEKLLSVDFAAFLAAENELHVAEMLKHEIGITIKGRAGESWDRYRQLTPIRYNLPVRSESDRGFIFTVFKRYKEKLEQSGQFDTDDVVLTALGQLDTPLWRRRRIREGFDSIFIDETHLFNLNELWLFHYLTRRDGYCPIVFAVDRAQAVGDRALSDAAIGEAVVDKAGVGSDATTRMAIVFRSAPAVLNAAHAVLSSGAALFTNLENPLAGSASAFTADEEDKSAAPRYTPVADSEMESAAFSRAVALADELKCSRSEIAIVCFAPELYRRLARFAKDKNKPVELLERRGDLEVVSRARKGNLFVLAAPEYVGGLEFDGVVLVGVDERRVPPSGGSATIESKQYTEYAAFNLLYVALTRARFRVEMLGDSASRPTTLLASAISSKYVVVADPE